MEPLDTDMEYMVREPRPSNPTTRFNALLIFPILGIVLLLVFIVAAIFQLDLTDLIDSLMGLMTVFFIALVVMLFWAFAPRVHKH